MILLKQIFQVIKDFKPTNWILPKAIMQIVNDTQKISQPNCRNVKKNSLKF